MKNLSIKKLLSLAFGALALLVLVVSLFALHGLSGANDRFSGYVHGAAERESLATDVRTLANRRAIGVPSHPSGRKLTSVAQSPT